ncbi:hypothetical protein P0Y35_03840 [Kiritimatiellaeota bacterium B1221]|nr:hypothetical protein [Kiritimatiellaeota bacterium B1221]
MKLKGLCFNLILLCSLPALWAQMELPFTEPLESAGLPQREDLAFETYGEGRIQMVQGITNEVGMTIAPTILSGELRFRGNVYQSDIDSYLFAHDFYLERAEAQLVHFIVYEGSTLTGAYSQVHVRSKWVPAGEGYVSSGEFLLPLEAGKYYIIGAGWIDDTGYGFNNSNAQEAVAFGTLVSGYTNSTTATPGNIQSISPSGNRYLQRLRSGPLFTTTLPSSAANSSSVNSGIFRGQKYRVDRDHYLLSHEMNWTRGEESNARFMVYESDTENGTFVRISDLPVVVSVGNGSVSSGDTDLWLRAGKYYIIGAYWEGDMTYYYRTGSLVTPESTEFGEALKGVQVTGVQETLLNPSTPSTAYAQTLLTMPPSALRMDSVVEGQTGTSTINLTLDLDGVTSATLHFEHRAMNETSGVDGVVLFDVDHQPFVLLDLPDGTTNWESFSLDIVAMAIENEANLDGPVSLVIQQSDTGSWPSAGREFRDIHIDVAPDLVAISQEAQITKYTFRGFDDPKVIPLSQELSYRAGSEDLSNQPVTFLYEVNMTPQIISLSEVKTLNLPVGSEQNETRVFDFSIPANIKLPKVFYQTAVTLDSGNVLDEFKEGNNSTYGSFLVNHYSGVLWFNGVETSIEISDWEMRSYLSDKDHKISGTGTVNGKEFTFNGLLVVKDPVTLDYTVDATDTHILPVDPLEEVILHGVRYRSDGGMELSKDGLFADLVVVLPAGLGWTDDDSRMDLYGEVIFPSTSLTDSFTPSGSLFLSDNIWVVEETKPLMLEVQSLTWQPSSGSFSFPSTGNVLFVRENAYELLEGDANNNDIPEDHGFRRSNSQYYRYVSLLPGEEILVETGSDGEALLSANFIINEGGFITHLPYDSTPAWSGQGVLEVVQDQIGPNSKIIDAAVLKVSYNQNCPDNCPDDKRNDTLVIPQPADFVFTPQGGLVTEGNLSEGSKLSWGALPDEGALPDFAQESGPFFVAAYMASGHFIRGKGGEAPHGAHTPGWLMNLGSEWGDSQSVIAADMSEYYTGEGRFPGLNFRMDEHPDADGFNVLGGVAWDPFNLSDRAKYYVRQSGVTGIHEAESFKTTGKIYGYQFSFSSLGFSYLSSSPVPGGSRTNGDLTFGEPIDDVIEFKELSASCKGELGEAAPADNNELIHFLYWDLDYTLYQLAFRRSVGCDVGSGTLVTTGVSEIELFAEPMFGELALGPDNDILSASQNDVDVDSRFSVPASIRVAGRDDQHYGFVPVHEAYLNDFKLADPQYVDMGEGYFSLAGALDIPFFNALSVQLHFTSGDGILHMMGGWPDDGWKIEEHDFFDLENFDEDHLTWPRGQGVSLDEYRSSTLASYLPAAHKTIAGLVEVRYPLSWDSSTRSFASIEPENDVWLATSLEHQVDYMDAQNVEISFGIKYDGLPRLNLTNFVINELGEQSGIAQAIVEAGADEVMGYLEEGMQSLDKLLKPVSGNVSEPLIEELLEPVLRGFYDDLHNAYAEVEDELTFRAWLEGAPVVDGSPIDDLTVDLKNDLENQIKDYFFSGVPNGVPSGEVTGYFDRLLREIDSSIVAVDAMTPSFHADPSAGGAQLSGFLFQDADGEFPILESLTGELLGMFATDLLGDLNALSDEAIQGALEDLKRPLQAASEELDLVKSELEELRRSLNDEGMEFRQELLSMIPDPALPNAEDLIDQWADEASTALLDYLLTLPPDRNPLLDYDENQWVDLLKDEVVLEFLNSRFQQQIAAALRSRVYDLEGRFRKAVDSVFANLNRAMRELLSDVLVGLDNDVNEFVGNLESYVGSGQIDGYAQVREESLERLRLDGKFVWKVPSDMEFKGFLEIDKISPTGNPICNPGAAFGEYAESRKVTIGALELPCSFLESDIRVNIQTSMSFTTSPDSQFPIPVGLGGEFWLSDSSDPLGFEDFALTDFGIGVAFGTTDGYLAGHATGTFNEGEVSAGMFFGATCSLDPLIMVDPDVGNLLGDVPLVGGYVYGEGWVPVVNYGCALNLSGGVGAGIFFFMDADDDPVFGMKILLGAKGEAICAVTVRGEIRMVGLRRDGRFIAQGTGRVSGSVGDCDWACLRFGKTVTVTYDDGNLDVSY